MAVCVFQDWLFDLTMQQQSVLVLGCRGPDGIAKFHPTKEVVARYRATVLKAAYLGRPMRIDEGDNTTFMTLRYFSDDGHWLTMVRDFFDHVDSLPHHYYMHLMHGAQIAGYKHPSAASTDCVQCHQAPPSHYMGHFHMISKMVAGQEHARVEQCYLCHQTDSWNAIRGVGWYKHH